MPRSPADAGTVLAETGVRVLGPVRVTGPAGPARLGGAIPRALLGLLALRTGLVVPAGSLIDALWGEDAPRTARRTLQSHVCRLRRALDACGLPDALATWEHGYALTLPPGAVDALRFIDVVRQVEDDGSVKSPESVSKLLDDALELWRGDPFDGHDLFDWAVGEVARLRELRVGAIERLWECAVLTGGHAQAIPELERLVTVYPLRERLWELLIVALDSDGRRADALTAYQRVRRTLVDELGVEPGPALRRCHSRVLTEGPG
jgi:DNA-binding SARP family transcriptional activator